MLRCTKSAVLECLEHVLRLKKLHVAALNERQRINRNKPKRNVAPLLFLKLQELVVLCDRQAVIEPSKSNTRALLASALALHNFFKDVVCRLPEQSDWPELAAKHEFLDSSFALSSSIICPDRITLEESRAELRDQADERKKAKERARRIAELIDMQTEFVDEEKEITLEDAVLIVQKLERVYQAVARYNYLRHVYQQAMDDRIGKKTMTDEEAIIRIQARTRGYFARKMVREMRRKELDLLNMSTRALVDSLRLNVKISDTFPILEEPARSLEDLLEELQDNFFPPVPSDQDDSRILQRKLETEELYRKLCLKRLVKEIKKPRIELHELVSDTTKVTTHGRQLDLDIRLYLNCAVLIPLALRGWYQNTQRTRLLIVGEAGSGRTAWTEAAVYSTGAVNLRVSAHLLLRGRTRAINNIVKYVKADPCSIVTIDRMEIFKIMKKKMTTISQNIIRNLLEELEPTNCFIIAMSRSDDLQPQILKMFTDVLYLKPLKESLKTEMIARSIVKLEDRGRLAKMPEKLYDLKKATKGKTCGKTTKIIRSRYGRSQPIA